jgi:hypothetical protein
MEYSQIIAANKTRCLSGEAKYFPSKAHVCFYFQNSNITAQTFRFCWFFDLLKTHNIRNILLSFSALLIVGGDLLQLRELISHFHCARRQQKQHRDIVDGTHVAASQFVKISPLHCARMHYSEKLSRLTIKLCASMRPALKYSHRSQHGTFHRHRSNSSEL